MDLDTASIDAQIAKLQAERQRKIDLADRARREQEKQEARVLIGSTPTKKKPRLDENDLNHVTSRPPQPRFAALAKIPRPAKQVLPSIPAHLTKSTLSSSLAALRRTSYSPSEMPQKSASSRSSTFAERPQSQIQAEAGPSRHTSQVLEVDEPGPQRESDLTILENLKLGPQEFGLDPEGDTEWLHFEPNSKIRLIKRVLSHSSLQDHMYGRYYLPPSLLYSVIRLSKDGATYDVPVEGDWITIAVVAERSEIKVSGSKEEFSDDEDEDVATAKQGDKALSQEQQARKKWVKRRGPRKYINLKLCALPPKNKSMGGEGVKGDALLQLLLFEADAQVHGLEDGEKKYRGGSGGAYEKWCNLAVGSVIAILNPRVLRPLRSGAGGQTPHPLTLPLAINPTSADAITLIGQSRDLGCCSATQRDGNRCKTWIDLRVSAVCEYHIHAAIQRGRGGRAEFASATTSFALTSRPAFGGNGKEGKYDPRHKTGLGPRGGPQAAPRALENGGGGATYVVGGQTVSTRDGFKGVGDEHLSEKLGRNRAGKRKRALEAKETEKALNALLEKDTGIGGSSTGGKYLAILRKANGESGKSAPNKMGQGGDESQGGDRKRPFSVGAIKKIGFDPSARRGVRDEEETAKRLDAIASLRDGNERPLNLSRPKHLSRSNVRAPPIHGTAEAVSRTHDSNDNDNDDDDMINLD